MIFDLATALFIDSATKVFGTSEQTDRKLQASVQMNREADQMVENVARSTNAIWNEIAESSVLLAESMKNDNLRWAKQIAQERQKILNS